MSRESSTRLPTRKSSGIGRDGCFSVRAEEGGVLSSLALGPRKSGAQFSIEDVDLLGYIAANSWAAHERINLQIRLSFEKEERERLEEFNRMKIYFASNVSHDMKTPLTTIMIHAETLEKRRKLPAARVVNYLKTIQGELKRLTRFINNVPDVAKSERASTSTSGTSFEVISPGVSWRFNTSNLPQFERKRRRSK